MKATRSLLKTTVANTLHYLYLDRIIGDSLGKASTPLIICYHRVVQDFHDAATRAMPSLLVSTTMFEQQLDWLAQHFDMVSLDKIFEDSSQQNHQRKKNKGKRQATISFDDGYADFYWNALPILQKKVIPSSVFVVTDLVGTSNLQTHDELYLLLSQWYLQSQQSENGTVSSLSEQLETALNLHSNPFLAARYLLAVFSQQEVMDMMKQLRAHVNVSAQSLQEFQSLSWPMLRELNEQGVTVGSHTRSHALLPHHNQQRLVEELQDSRQRLSRELGVATKYLAYPDGQFDERTARAAQEAGYEGALTICNHLSQYHPLYTMPRQVLWEKACIDKAGNFSPAIMGCLANGLFNFSSRCTQDHTVS